MRRVARARHFFAAYVADRAFATSLCIAGSMLAQASPRALLRPAELALFGVKQARVVGPNCRRRQCGAASQMAAAKARKTQYRYAHRHVLETSA